MYTRRLVLLPRPLEPTPDEDAEPPAAELRARPAPADEAAEAGGGGARREQGQPVARCPRATEDDLRKAQPAGASLNASLLTLSAWQSHLAVWGCIKTQVFFIK